MLGRKFPLLPIMKLAFYDNRTNFILKKDVSSLLKVNIYFEKLEFKTLVK